MKWIWPALVGLLRPLYLAYAWWCRLFLPASVLGAWWLWHLGEVVAGLGAFGLALLFYLALALSGNYQVWRNSQATQANPWQSAFMAWFGTLKFFRNSGQAAGVQPQWSSTFLVENPRGYQIGGKQTRAILQSLQSGDILLRGYEGFVDGTFIRRSSLSAGSGFRAGWFTHAALYVGALDAHDGAHVDAAFRDQVDYFSTGPQMVIHAMAKGVHCEDILTFLRCDYLCVLRLADSLGLPAGSPAPVKPWSAPPEPLSAAEVMHTRLWQDLLNGQMLDRADVVQAARQAALEKIGRAYDFDCSDTQSFSRFSCAELVYYCLRSVLPAIGLQPRPHALYPLPQALPNWRLLERRTITPDDIGELVGTGALRCVWIDEQSALHTQAGKAPG